MAEQVAKAMLSQAGRADEVSVESFGTVGNHVGEGAHSMAIEALLRRGWPYGGHSARRIAKADLANMDLVLCADRENLADLRRISTGIDHRGSIALLRDYDPIAQSGDDEVPDPWGMGAEDFDRALQMIERSCAGLLGQIA